MKWLHESTSPVCVLLLRASYNAVCRLAVHRDRPGHVWRIHNHPNERRLCETIVKTGKFLLGDGPNRRARDW